MDMALDKEDILKKKEYDKSGKPKKRRSFKYPVEKLSNPPGEPTKPKDPLELQLWKLNTRLGALQKEFRNHIEENK